MESWRNIRGTSFSDVFRKVFFCLSVLIVLLGTWNQEGSDGGGGSHFGGRGNGLVSAQSCADFNKTSQAELCAPYVTYNYYLPPGPTKWIIAALFSYNANMATKQATFFPSECERKILPFICGNIYKGCDDTSVPGQVLERPLCRSQCDKVVKKCKETFESNGQPLPECSEYPEEETEVEVKGESVTVQCFSLNHTLPIPEFPFDCTFPMAYKEGAEPFPCAVQCPVPLLTSPIRNSINVITRYFIPISEFALLIFGIIQCLQYDYWFKFPRQYIVYNTFAIIISHIAFLIPGVKGGFKEVGCVDESTGATNDVALCNFCTWCLYIGAWGNDILFAIISTNVLLAVLQVNEKRYQRILNWFYHFWIFVPPLAILGTTEGLGMTGFSSGISHCWFDASVAVPGLGEDTLNTLFVIIPFMVMLSWGYFMVIVSLFILYRKTGLAAVVKQTRLIAFLFIYGSWLIISLAGAYQRLVQGQDLAEEYLVCEVGNWVAGIFGTPSAECHRSNNLVGEPFLFVGGSSFNPIVFAVIVIVFFSQDCWRVFRSTSSARRSGISRLTGVGKRTTMTTQTSGGSASVSTSISPPASPSSSDTKVAGG